MSFFTECILSKCVILCAHCISVCLRKTVSCTGIHYSFLSFSLWHMNSVYFLRFLKMFQKIHWKFIFKLNQYIDAENKYLTSSFGYFFIFVLWFFDSVHHTVQNQITFYCHITTAHVPCWVKFLRAYSRQCRNNLLIDSTYLQTYTEDNVQNTHTYSQYTQCTF